MLGNDDENLNFHSMQLCYGDYIALENPEENNSFVFSDGFLKTKLNMKTFDEANTIRADFFSCIFEIYPQFANTNKCQALKLPEELEENKNLTGQQKKEKIEEMQEKLTDEYTFNLDTFNKQKNFAITYGKIVQLMHIASNKFLSVTFIEADKEKENYQIKLEEYSSESTFFKILPSFAYQKESEGKVFVEDIVFIACAGTYLNKTPYLHCSDTKPQVREKKTGPSYFQTNFNDIGFHSKRDPLRQSDSTALNNNVEEEGKGTVKISNKQVTEINASLEKATYWRIHLFCKIFEDHMKEFLSYGDVIWLNNFDKKISLLGRYSKRGAKRLPADETKEANLESTQLEVFFADAILNEDSLDNLGNTNGMWVIEQEDFTKGGLVLATDVFRLKHFPSGKYLCAEKRENHKYELLICEEINEKSLFSMVIIQESMTKGVSQQEKIKYVSKDAYITIKHKKSGFFLGIAEVKKERLDTLYRPLLNKAHTDEDVLKISRATTNELLETNFLKSCKNLLNKYIAFLAKMHRKTVTIHEITAVQGKAENVGKCLKDLELFVTNQLFNTSPYVKFGSINQRRQKILREQYYLEILIQLLQISMGKIDLERYFYLKEQTKDNKDLDARRSTIGGAKKKFGFAIQNIVSKIGKSSDQQKAQEDRLFLRMNSEKLKIIKMTFRLFIYICRDFEENELYMFDLIPTFSYYFEYVSSSIDFLISLVRNNESIMKRVSQSLGSLSLSAIEKLSLILEMELANHEDVAKDSNIAQIANSLKQKMKKNEMIEQFIKQISEEEAGGVFSLGKSLSLSATLMNKSDTLAKQSNLKQGSNIYEEEFKQMKNNLILLFAAIAKKNYKKERNLRLLRFFRSICSYQKKGITANQEILSKIFKNESYHKAFLVKVVVDNDNMKIESVDGKILFFEEIFLVELKIKRRNRLIQLTNGEDDPEEEGEISNIMNKSKIDATFSSFDRGVTSHSALLPTLTKDDEKNEDNKTELFEMQMGKMISYLNEQLIFYSDLCLGRNYIWKINLEGVFPIQFVFAQIFNKKIFKETRSAFTRLALNLYIDQQPFYPAIYPQLCRIFSPKSEAVRPESHDVTVLFSSLVEGASLEKKVFEGLLKESLEYIKAKSLKINGALSIYDKKRQIREDKGTMSPTKVAISKAELSPDVNQKEDPRFKNYLNNMLLLDVLQIVSKLLSFKLFKLSHEEDPLLTLFPNLVNLLEFDYSNPLISLATISKREKTFKIEMEKKKQNLMSTGFSGIKNLFSDVVENVTGLTKEMAGTLLGQSAFGKSLKKKTNAYLDRYNEKFRYSNPLMRSCVSQRNQLNKLLGDDEGKLIKVEKDLKMLIIDTIKHFLAMRNDFLLTNFIAWYQDIDKRCSEVNDEKLRAEINENFTTVIPEVLKVGIIAVDFKYQLKEEENVLNNIGGNFKNLMGNIGNFIGQEEEERRYLLKKFKIYTKDKEIKDLDNLLAGYLEDKVTISKTLFPSLIMMFYSTQDPMLECKFLELIMLCFHQRVLFADSIKNLELLFEKQDIENYLHMTQMVREMKSICEKSEVWISEWLNTGQSQKESAELTKIVKFFIVTMYMSSAEAESKLEIEEIKSEEEQEFVLINSVRQKIACFLGVHETLMDFLKDTLHLMDKILKDERIELKAKEQFLTLYKKVFVFLKYFVKNNTINQEILHESLNLFLIHMDLDLGQTELVCEIFMNNQDLCENVKVKTLNEFIALIKTIGRREKFLEIFETLQTCNGEPIFESQAKIVNALLGNTQNANSDALLHVLYVQRDENQNILFDFESKPLNYYFSQHQTNHSYILQFSENLYGDKPYKYHAKLLKVLALTGNGTQGYNLSNARLRKQFNLQLLFLTLIQDEDVNMKSLSPLKNNSNLEVSKNLVVNKDNEESMSPFSKKINSMKKDRNLSKKSAPESKGKNFRVGHLKLAMMQYLKSVFLPIKNEKDEFQVISESVQSFFRKELENLRETSVQDFRNEGFRDYFFDGVLRFLKEYVQTIVTPPVVVENLERKDNEILFCLAETLVEKLADLQNTLTGSQMNALKAFIMLYFKENEELNQKISLCLEEDERKNPKNFSQSNVSLLTENFEEGLENPNSWKAFVKLCLRADILEKEIEKEKRALCESIIKIHLMFDEEEKKKYKINIDMKAILQKLVNYIEFALGHKHDKETVMFTLEILIKIVNIYPKKQEIQNTLDQINALTMILTVIAEMKNLQISDDIFDSLLSFLIVMIEGGNQNSQKSAFNYFTTIPSSEFVFERFYSIINDQIEVMKAKKQDVHEITRRHRHHQNETENLRKKILEKILRIMQMLTEGHYQDMQMYLQFQTNSRNSYDLVSSVIELLYVYHTDLGANNYHNILRCLETLTELVQGPCQQNQSALIEGKFLEIAFSILETRIKKDKQHLNDLSMKRKTLSEKRRMKKGKKATKTAIELAKLKKTKSSDPNKLKRWMLERIKYKCMILIYSLLEMKTGDDFVKRIIRSLPMDILKTNLCEIYRKYKKRYQSSLSNLKLKKESLKKYDDDPDDKDNKNSESEYELIIETGFYTFFLINEYLEVMNDPELEFDDPVKGDNKDNLLKGSIIGQLGSLGLSLMNAGIDTVQFVGKAVNKNIIQQLMNNPDQDESEKEKLKKEMRAMELKAILPEALKFFNQNSGHIEVWRQKKLEKVYFMLPTYCHYLPEETKEEFNELVDRSSLETKLEEFVNESNEFIRIAKHEEKLAFFFNQNKFLAIFANYVSLWKEMAFFMNIVLNIFIIFSFSDYPHNDLTNGYLTINGTQVNLTTDMIWSKRMYEPHLMGKEEYSTSETKSIMQKCGIVMIVCACFVVLFFLCKKAPLYIQQSWGDEQKEPEDEDDPTKKKKPFSIRLFLFVKRVATCFVKFFLNVDVIYYVAYAALAILGATVHEFFFCFHLTELFFRFPTLKNVIRAVYEPREALIYTFILWLILEYIFAIWGFNFLRDQYSPTDDLNDSFCQELLICWLYTFDYTFKSNGGIGSQLDSLRQYYLDENPSLPKFTLTRFVFDNLFTIIIVIVMVTIVAGIIIDTFGVLRDNENMKLRDMERVCFICGQNKEIFERQVDIKKGFSMHILKEHCQWNYVFFIAFLKDKDPGEYTGIESFIHQKLADSDLSWFPKNRALSLETTIDEGDEQKKKDFINNTGKDLIDFKEGTILLKETLAAILRGNNNSP